MNGDKIVPIVKFVGGLAITAGITVELINLISTHLTNKPHYDARSEYNSEYDNVVKYIRQSYESGKRR